MAIIDVVARELHMKPVELINESLKTYLKQKLASIDANMYIISKKYGIRDVFDFDAKVQKGFLREEDAFDDYFKLDNLQHEREKINTLLAEL